MVFTFFHVIYWYIFDTDDLVESIISLEKQKKIKCFTLKWSQGEISQNNEISSVPQTHNSTGICEMVTNLSVDLSFKSSSV